MEIRKIKNDMDSYDFYFREDNKELKIMFSGNLDLYLVMSNGDLLPNDSDSIIDFYITKEDYQVFNTFQLLYESIINGEVFENSFDNYSNTYEYMELVDQDKNINWISDGGPIDIEDKLIISKIDDDSYRLRFMRINSDMLNFKNNTSISVRIRNSRSKYSPFNYPFMRMYDELQSLEPEYHQIHFEELEFAKKLKKVK